MIPKALSQTQNKTKETVIRISTIMNPHALATGRVKRSHTLTHSHIPLPTVDWNFLKTKVPNSINSRWFSKNNRFNKGNWKLGEWGGTTRTSPFDFRKSDRLLPKRKEKQETEMKQNKKWNKTEKEMKQYQKLMPVNIQARASYRAACSSPRDDTIYVRCSHFMLI